MTNETLQTISRTYRGNQGTKDFQEDATKLAGYGYVIASQVQTQGGRTAAASLFIVVGVLFLVLGIFFLPLWIIAIVCLIIGLVSGKSPNQLAVVWTAPPVAASKPVEPTSAPNSPLAAINTLAALRDKGAITTEEYEAKKAELLSRL